MECKSIDSKKLFKVFDASKRKRTRKKRDGIDDSNSVATDGSTSCCQANLCGVASGRASLQDMSCAQDLDGQIENCAKRERDSSPSVSRTPVDAHRIPRSPRRNRRPMREGISLALKAGLTSTPRSVSPQHDVDGAIESVPQDHDSFIYAFLEEAVKRDKKKQKHAKKHEERRPSRERDPSRDHHRRHRRRHDRLPSRERDKTKDKSPSPRIDQTALLETFAKLCVQLNEKVGYNTDKERVPRTQSHKSLQCEVSRRDSYDIDRRPLKLVNLEQSNSRENLPPLIIRSQDNFSGRVHSRDNIVSPKRKDDRTIKVDKYDCCAPHDKDCNYRSRLDTIKSIRNIDEERYHDYPPVVVPTRSFINHVYRPRNFVEHGDRDYRGYNDDRRGLNDSRQYENRGRCSEQKTSRSFETHREKYPYDERDYRRTTRSDTNKEKRYEDKRYLDRDVRDKSYESRDKFYEDKIYDERERHTNLSTKGRRSRRNFDRYDKNSVLSRDDDYKDRDKYSERERDSGLSAADGETSTMSGRSNYLRVVKQEITEQREAMDKMMKLWKELMRSFKGISQTQGQDKAINESAANARDSAAAQLRLWRECMRRYETVARDVGDTDARLMEEINKQRSEMAEMATMWQECLQRYREMSSDFNNLKQKLTTPESPVRMPAPPLVCAEGEGTLPQPAYRLPPNYTSPPQLPPMPGGYVAPGSPLRTRASAPPAWWWCGEGGPRSPRSPRRRSSPDSRGSRDRDRRRRHKDTRDREDSRYRKDKSSKPSAARSEHRHRKR